MSIKTISEEEFQELSRRTGIPIAEEDDPIYSEGPSVVFLHRMSGQSTNKATGLTRDGSQTSSDTPPKKTDERR